MGKGPLVQSDEQKMIHSWAIHIRNPKDLKQVPKDFLDQRKIDEYWKGYKSILVSPKMPAFGILLSSSMRAKKKENLKANFIPDT